MQTKKKGSGRAAARENAGSRVLRASKKTTHVKEPEKKVTDLITSSARKQNLGRLSNNSSVVIRMCSRQIRD